MKFPIVGKKGKSDHIGKVIDVAQLSIEGTRARGSGTRILLWQGSLTSRLSEGNGPQNSPLFSPRVPSIDTQAVVTENVMFTSFSVTTALNSLVVCQLRFVRRFG